MEDGAFGGSFGKYDVTTHDQNKKNTGYNNSLYEGSNFSTTLGGNFSTVVGANFSTTGGLTMSTVVGLNMPVTLGGKIELISPWSIKWTKGSRWEGGPGWNSSLPMVNAGGYDYDFKDCQTQVKWNEGTVYNYSKRGTIELGLRENCVVGKKVETFANQAEKWLKKETTACTEEIKKIVSGTMTYGTMTTTATTSYDTTSAGPITFYGAAISMTAATTMDLKSATSVKITAGGATTINGLTIKVG